jgi:anti-sigma factor RsiW
MINRDNFEMYCMLYADGELLPADIQAFDTFLENNPDLLSEWQQWQQLKLHKDALLFPDKAALLQPVSETLSEEQAWLYIDGELSLIDRTATEERLRSDATSMQLIQELRSLVLEPTKVACPDKESLFRINRQRPVIVMRWMLRVAAAVLIVVICWPLFTEKPLQKVSTAEEVISKSLAPSPSVDSEEGTTNSRSTQAIVSAKPGKMLLIPTHVSGGNETPAKDLIVENTLPISETKMGNQNVIASTENGMPPEPNNQPPQNTINSLSANPTENSEPESHNLAQPVIYQELNTESEREIINIGALEIREGHFRGIIRKAGALLKRAGTRPPDTQEYKVITVAQPLHP